MPVLQLASARIEFEGTASTQVFLLLGFPVSHSLSPVMQNAAFRAAGIEALYVACAVDRDEIPAAMRDLRQAAAEGRIAGANVTVPHKQSVLPHLDRLDPTAALAGAVNTIVLTRPGPDGKRELQGFNTDVDGLVEALVEIDARLAGARFVILGAGGMARAAVAAALRQGANEIRVCARDPLRGQEMLDAVAEEWRGPAPLLACTTLDEAPRCLEDADVLVQATSLGRAANEMPVDCSRASERLHVLDAVYTPGGTPLVRAARARGLRAADGLSLLAYQGALSFELWTGVPAPLAVMRKALALPESGP